MKKGVTNAVDSVLLITGIGIGLDQIESILGIIILALQLLWIISKCVIKLYDKVKHKQYDQIDDVFKESAEEVEHLKDNIGGDNK